MRVGKPFLLPDICYPLYSLPSWRMRVHKPFSYVTRYLCVIPCTACQVRRLRVHKPFSYVIRYLCVIPCTACQVRRLRVRMPFSYLICVILCTACQVPMSSTFSGKVWLLPAATSAFSSESPFEPEYLKKKKLSCYYNDPNWELFYRLYILGSERQSYKSFQGFAS